MFDNNRLCYLILQNYGTVQYVTMTEHTNTLLASTWSKAICPVYGEGGGVVAQALGQRCYCTSRHGCFRELSQQAE